MGEEVAVQATAASKQQEDFELDFDIYASLSRAAELRDIKLLESKYEIKPEVFETLENLAGMDFGFHGEPAMFYFDEEEGLAIGQYRWKAEIKSGRKKELKFLVIYLVAYTGLKSFDEGHVRFYFEKVGRFSTYPYFRGLFAQHTSSSGMMLPPLPSLNERAD